MALSRETMLARMLASDSLYDGKFITGVLSTGIYCLPSCRAKKPKPENVVFHTSPGEARAAGLRPCQRCRPDDFYGGRHAGEAVVEALVACVARDPGAYRNVRSLAKTAGVSSSKLHELFRTHYHTTPAEFLARARVTAARRALVSSDQPIARVAYEVGFESLSAFGANFRKFSYMSPQAFRRLGEPPRFELTLPQGYPLLAVLDFLGRDQASPTDRVEGRTYTAVWRLSSGSVTVRLTLEEGRARCAVTSARAPQAADLLQVHDKLLRTLGLHADPARFEAFVAGDAALAPLIEGQAGLRVPLLADFFGALIWAVVGQQITFAFACTLRRRLVERWGERVDSGLYALPTPEIIARLDPGDLVPLGFPRSKAEYLIGAAQATLDGRLPLCDLPGQSATRTERTLLAVRGIGPWSAHYLLMRAYGFSDCVPLGDSGLAESLKRFFALSERPTRAQTLHLMNRFGPHRSLATFHLWHRLQRFAPVQTPVQTSQETNL